MNGECLELEDLNHSLKKEVKDAWDSYKLSLDKYSLREDEYQDELKQLNKNKQQEVAKLNGVIDKLQVDLQDSLQLHKRLEVDHEKLKESYTQSLQECEELRVQLEAHEDTINQSKENDMKDIQSIHEELKQSYHDLDLLRHEHNSYIRLSQNRQNELESSNNQLTITISEQQKELTRLTSLLESSNQSNQYLHELEQIKGELHDMTKTWELEQEKSQALDR